MLNDFQELYIDTYTIIHLVWLVSEIELKLKEICICLYASLSSVDL
jgi:hypothetical protein